MAETPTAVTGAVDWALDKSVVLGYTRVGYAARQLWWPADPDPGALAGRHVLVTGATSGIGQATARGLAGLGATVHLVGRDRGRLDEAVAGLAAEVPEAQLEADVCDVGDLDAVRGFAVDFAERVPRLHALVHNAGTMAPTRTQTAQGHELTLATHVLGPFLLTRLLRAPLRADGDARVVFTSSGGMYAESLHADDLEYERGRYSATTAYARTKRMQVVLAEMWADRLRSDHVAVHSMHPGWVDTPGVRRSLPRFRALTRAVMRDAAQGADTIVWLAASPEAARRSGLFWHDRRPRSTGYARAQREPAGVRRRLWQFCEDATRDAQGAD